MKALGLSGTSKQYIAYLAILNLGFFIFHSYYIIYLRANGLSYTDIGVIYAAYFIALAILNLVAGNFADRHGRKKAIIIGGMINVVGFLVYGLSSSFELFLLAELILAGSAALIGGTVEAWLVDALKERKRPAEAARTFPLNSSVSNILGIVGGVIGSVLAAIALNLPMLAAAAFVGLATVIAFLLFQENFGERAHLFSQLIKQSFAHFRHSPALKNLTYAEMWRNSAVVVYLIIYQPYMVTVGLGEEYLGVFFSLLMISTAAGNLSSMVLADRIGRHRLLALSCVVLFASFILQPLVHDFALSGLLFAMSGFTNGLALPTVMTWRNSLIPSRIRASTLAILSSLTNLAIAAMSLGLGPVIDSSSLQAAMYVGAILAILAVPFYFRARRRSDQEVEGLREGSASI